RRVGTRNEELNVGRGATADSEQLEWAEGFEFVGVAGVHVDVPDVADTKPRSVGREHRAARRVDVEEIARKEIVVREARRDAIPVDLAAIAGLLALDVEVQRAEEVAIPADGGGDVAGARN